MLYDVTHTLPMEAPTEVRHAQVVYLDKVLNIPREIIAQITGYARSTISGIISKLKNCVEECKKFFEKVVDYVVQKVDEIHYAYLIKIYGEVNYTKVGYTKNLNQRMKQLSKKYGDIEILKLYEFKDKENALTMENAMRKHFKQQGQLFVPQDRFLQFNPTESDYKELNNKYEFINTNL